MEDNFKLIECNDDDAITFHETMFKLKKLREKIKRLLTKQILGEELTKLFKAENLNIHVPAQEINRKFHRYLYEKWFDEGIPCEILKLGSNRWQKGKIRINLQVSIEFCPDEPEIKEPESPLDDLRRKINEATS